METTPNPPPETLNPVPIPEQPDLSGIIVTDFLSYQEPIDSPELLAHHVAQLTGIVEYLFNEVEQLKNERRTG